MRTYYSSYNWRFFVSLTTSCQCNIVRDLFPGVRVVSYCVKQAATRFLREVSRNFDTKITYVLIKYYENLASAIGFFR